MDNNLRVFTNEEFGSVRTVTIDGEPWFIGKDVATALGYAEPRSAVSKKVESEDRGVAEMATPSGIQKMTVINESGLYSLILSSKLPTAKKFKHWITSEVIPSIRKHDDEEYTDDCKDIPDSADLKEFLDTITEILSSGKPVSISADIYITEGNHTEKEECEE